MGDKEQGEQPNAARGYRPLVLTLTGFKGIRSGLGRDTLRSMSRRWPATQRWWPLPEPMGAARQR